MSGENPFRAKKFEPNAEQKAFLEAFGRRLQDIARTISDDPNLKVEMGEAGTKLWYYNAKEDVVRWDPAEVLERPQEELDVLRGSIAHEGGHVAITRFFDFVDPKALHEELGLHSVLMACEERPTDHVVRVRFPGAGTWVDAMREVLNREGSKDEAIAYENGKLLKMVQFNNLIVFKPHMKEIPEYYDKDVLNLYEESSGIIEKIEKMLPPKGASEQRVLDDCKERYRLIYKELWPKVKELVKDDLETQKQNQLLQKEIQKALNGESSQIYDEMLKDIVDKILEFLKDMAKSVTPQEKGLEEAIKKMHEAGDESGEEIEKGEGELESENLDEAIEKLKSKVGSNPDSVPIPMDKLTDEQKEFLKQMEAKLSDEAKEKLQEAAKQILEKIEDDVVKKLAGKMTEHIESHEEVRIQVSLSEEDEDDGEEMSIDDQEGDEQPEDETVDEGVVDDNGELEKQIRELEEEENLKKLREQAEKKLKELEDNKSEYDKVYEQVREYDEELYSALEEHFHPTRETKAKLKMVGSRLNLPAVYKWEAARKGGGKNIPAKIFETLSTPEELDHSVTILVDLSGSMAGEKIEETFKAIVSLSEVLNRLGVPFEVLGFQIDLYVFKSFEQDLNNKTRGHISTIANSADSYNLDGPNLERASERLAAQSTKRKILMVVSDGLPCGINGVEELHKAVNHIINNTDQNLLGVGIGPGTEFVSKFYPFSVTNVSIDEFPEKFGALLGAVMTNPDAFLLNKNELGDNTEEEANDDVR